MNNDIRTALVKGERKFIESWVEKVVVEGAVNVFQTAVQDLLVDHD